MANKKTDKVEVNEADRINRLEGEVAELRGAVDSLLVGGVAAEPASKKLGRLQSKKKVIIGTAVVVGAAAGVAGYMAYRKSKMTEEALPVIEAKPMMSAAKSQAALQATK